MRGHKDGFHLTVRQFRSLNVLQPLRIPTPAARPRSCRSDRANCYLRRGIRMAPAAAVDRRRYPDARLPDVLVDGLGGRCKSKERTSALGGSPLNLFSEVVATLIKVRFYGMSALQPKPEVGACIVERRHAWSFRHPRYPVRVLISLNVSPSPKAQPVHNN